MRQILMPSSYQWKGRLDLLNIIMIGIADVPSGHNDKQELHHLPATLLSMNLSANEKLSFIETEYNIPVDDKRREEVNVMCNLSQGIFEKGMARGEARGEAKGEAKILSVCIKMASQQNK